MPIAKTTAELTPAADVRKRQARPENPQRTAGGEIEFLSLQVEDDGGDPYNCTGQHCLAELKKTKQ